MHSFVRNLITEWRRLGLPFEGETVIVAVSGGADSVSLLLAIADLGRRKKIDHRIVAAHCNHGLRGVESDADQELVRVLAEKLGIDFVSEYIKISKKGNLEQNARDARYAILRKIADDEKAFAVLTGHTINDQAETFLLNLIRGSGTDGLAAMRSFRQFGTAPDCLELAMQNPELLLVRPLLAWAKRTETESFCKDSGFNFCSDAMNDDLNFRRVRIRKELIPMLETMNPKIVETLAGTAELLSKKVENSPIQTDVSAELKISDLKSLNESDLYRILRHWLGHHRGNMRGLGLKHIKAVVDLIFSEKSGRLAELPGGNVVRTGGKLLYQKN